MSKKFAKFDENQPFGWNSAERLKDIFVKIGKEEISIYDLADTLGLITEYEYQTGGRSIVLKDNIGIKGSGSTRIFGIGNRYSFRESPEGFNAGTYGLKDTQAINFFCRLSGFDEHFAKVYKVGETGRCTDELLTRIDTILTTQEYREDGKRDPPKKAMPKLARMLRELHLSGTNLGDATESRNIIYKEKDEQEFIKFTDYETTTQIGCINSGYIKEFPVESYKESELLQEFRNADVFQAYLGLTLKEESKTAIKKIIKREKTDKISIYRLASAELEKLFDRITSYADTNRFEMKELFTSEQLLDLNERAKGEITAEAAERDAKAITENFKRKLDDLLKDDPQSVPEIFRKEDDEWMIMISTKGLKLRYKESEAHFKLSPYMFLTMANSVNLFGSINIKAELNVEKTSIAKYTDILADGAKSTQNYRIKFEKAPVFTQKKNFELQINCNTEEAEISRLVIKYVPLNSQIKIEGNELSYSHREPFKNMLKSSATIKQAASEGLLGEFKELEKDEHEYERTKIKEIEDYNKFAYSAMIIEKAKKAGLTPARQKIFTIYKK